SLRSSWEHSYSGHLHQEKRLVSRHRAFGACSLVCDASRFFYREVGRSRPATLVKLLQRVAREGGDAMRRIAFVVIFGRMAAFLGGCSPNAGAEAGGSAQSENADAKNAAATLDSAENALLHPTGTFTASNASQVDATASTYMQEVESAGWITTVQ